MTDINKLSLLIFGLLFTLNVSAQKFEVTYSSDVQSDVFTGSVVLYLSKENKQPKNAFIAMELPPVYRVEVNALLPNETVIFDDSAVSYPVELSNIERGEYYVQAVFDRNLGGQYISMSPGNIYSEPIKVSIDKNFSKTYTLICNKVIDEIEFKETSHLKELKLKSHLLSEFHSKEVFIAGAISLPENYYHNTKTNYPVIFSTFGFGGSYKLHAAKGKYKFTQLDNTPAIVIYLDGNCSEGHSTYANSDINGPWGDALVKEFIPELEKRYRTNGAKFLFGHSSGGWTSLWLQINYPNTFSGAWASSPDQVDFRNWQGENIYEVKNMYYDDQGNLISDMLMGGSYPIISAKDLYRVENVIYRGEQIHSFDAVFSTRNKNGKIRRLVNHENGDINQDVLESFKRYDISYILQKNWEKYKSEISGKIRISIGKEDNFHLQKAVYLLEQEMKELGGDIEFEYFPGDHFTVSTDEYKKEGQQFLNKCYRNWLDRNK